MEMQDIQSKDYFISFLNKYPQIINSVFIFTIFQLIFLLYVSIIYKYHKCQNVSSIIFLLLVGVLFFLFLKKESNAQQRLKIVLFVTIVAVILMLNMIINLNEKTICNISVCHDNNIFQENINVVIKALKKDKQVCDQLNKRSSQSKEQQFEDTYSDSINFIWLILCKFYESLSMEKACDLTITDNNVFINYEYIIVCLIYFISLLLIVFLMAEIILKAYYKNEQEPESQNIPLIEYYQKSSINQKDQNDTSLYLDNQIYNQQNYNKNILVSSNSNIINPLDNITTDQSRVRKFDEQLSNQIYQQQQNQQQNNKY
ncbi:hypothetical protein ABPG72_016590 [Tetrahymena utriculariae]